MTEIEVMYASWGTTFVKLSTLYLLTRQVMAIVACSGVYCCLPCYTCDVCRGRLPPLLVGSKQSILLLFVIKNEKKHTKNKQKTLLSVLH